jgi:ubiquitin-conjugating enzyme E2 Z
MTTTISKNTLHRLLRDVSTITKHPLHSQGIYYAHDEDHILNGYALIIGPKDTPYQYGYYFFRLEYPYDYPERPPKVVYLTNDGTTRFHPNLYRSGKVCLSILNTWRGEQWSSCQTISSILLTLVSILDKNPLCNEPGFTVSHADNIPYNKMIYYKNFETAINGIINNTYAPAEYKHFKDIVMSTFCTNYPEIIKLIKSYNNDENNGLTRTSIYNMTVHIDYNSLLQIMESYSPDSI